jgi:hypothetical protein
MGPSHNGCSRGALQSRPPGQRVLNSLGRVTIRGVTIRGVTIRGVTIRGVTIRGVTIRHVTMGCDVASSASLVSLTKWANMEAEFDQQDKVQFDQQDKVHENRAVNLKAVAEPLGQQDAQKPSADLKALAVKENVWVATQLRAVSVLFCVVSARGSRLLQQRSTHRFLCRDCALVVKRETHVGPHQTEQKGR